MTYQVRDPFRSERLIFRAVQFPGDNDLFIAINDDRIGYQNSNASNSRLPSAADAEKWQKSVAEDSLLGAVIWLPPTPDALENQASESKLVVHRGTPIGQINLGSLSKGMMHHRFSEIAIDILPEYQGKGYGSEAIRWILDYAFRRLALHKVKIRAFEWNEGAVRLYERIGFRHEARQREEFWHEGRWWDSFILGILDREWKEMTEEKERSENVL
ncbi:acyl-CoA N-acyltransferase [Dendryphion nanum]|uniref:Acyl-CoA N-acyltransferase n=1 Tax=Dendryphion nanum TaxID=256645 RepID=A0A9P9E3T7_9PLEO|nr:acyl-CoA N-acyltransferase [Dendryphion nanum]